MGDSSCRGVCLFNIPRTLEIRDLRHSSVVPLDVLQFSDGVSQLSLLRVAGVDVGGRRKGFHAAVIEGRSLLRGPVPLRSGGSAIEGLLESPPPPAAAGSPVELRPPACAPGPAPPTRAPFYAPAAR